MSTRPDAFDRQLGQELRRLRLSTGLSQERLADAIGVTCQQISKYETGQSRLAAVRLAAIARALGIPVGALFIHLEGEQ